MKEVNMLFRIVSIIIFSVVFDNVTVYDGMAKTRIIGGDVVTNRSLFAYQASIRYEKMPLCGGAIIDKRHILTAAHCFRMKNIASPANLYVVVGNLHVSEETVLKKVQQLFIHEDYSPYFYHNDIAVLRIAGTFENWTDEIQPINLTETSITSGICTVSGWGNNLYLEKSGTQWLYSMEVPIVDWTFCNEQFTKSGIPLEDKVICAGAIEKDSCQRDSGGPLVCSDTLSGIVSYGVHCDRENYPGIYTEVAKYINWIEQQKQSPDPKIDETYPLIIIVTVLLCSLTFVLICGGIECLNIRNMKHKF